MFDSSHSLCPEEELTRNEGVQWRLANMLVLVAEEEAAGTGCRERRAHPDARLS